MILIDTSAWNGWQASSGIRTEIATCDVIRMEVLAGARDERHLNDLRRLLAIATHIATLPTDYDAAAAHFRTCRQRVGTVRTLIDCLIAAITIRVDIPILHNDQDFPVLARHTDVQIDSR